MNEDRSPPNEFWLRELTLQELRDFIAETKDAPADTPVVVHVIDKFTDEASYLNSNQKLDVAVETPIRAATIAFESFSEKHNELDDRFIESDGTDERTSLCVVYLNVISARHALRGDVDEFGNPNV
jgi:hypothetical protein